MNGKRCFHLWLACVLVSCFVFVLVLPCQAEKDVTGQVDLKKGAVTFNSRLGTSSLNTALINIGNEALMTPLKLVIDSVSKSRFRATSPLKAVNADGTTPDGKQYFLYKTNHRVLMPGEMTNTRKLTFKNRIGSRINIAFHVLAPEPQDPPSLSDWLQNHPNVANNIKWQSSCSGNGYQIPDALKLAWPNWSQQEKNELTSAFNSAWAWRKAQSGVFSGGDAGFNYPPINLSPTVADNNLMPSVNVSPVYARDLYIRWVALQLVVEIGNYLPWSITNYNDEQLQVLFDSAATMPELCAGFFVLGAANPDSANFVRRMDNLGSSLIAPPQYTYSFLVNSGVIGATRVETIGKLLDWARNNLAHYYGADTYKNYEDHWQYRGLPPITRIVEGTTCAITGEFAHWTAGCHGTTGFIRNVLRAANIPVHISTVCGHSQAVFLTENLYLDHGDNPYNLCFKQTGLPASNLLIDSATYSSRFSSGSDNRCDNVNDPANIGFQVKVLAPGCQ